MTESMTSVGIDIGTSTTSVVFSKIYVENTSGAARVPNYKIVDKEVVYRSRMYFTPLRDNTRLDTEKIMNIIEKEYVSAGILPENVSTGAVIITGDTARKENANDVLKAISHYAGDFVVATAGPDLESIIAGKGSGADKLSEKYFNVVANADVGGGTTNIAVFDNGEVVDAACFDIGGRLIRFKPGTMEVEYVYGKLAKLAEKKGFTLETGTVMSHSQVDIICDDMAEAMMDIILGRRDSPRYEFYRTNESQFHTQTKFDNVTFSGGVGELIYNPKKDNQFAFNDIGIVLAEKIVEKSKQNRIDVIQPAETISATVVGAGTHTTEVSGSTITVSNPDILPLQNIPIIKVTKDEEDDLINAVQKKLSWQFSGGVDGNVALYLTGVPNISFKAVQKLAEKILVCMNEVIVKNKLLILVLYNDFAKVLGQALRTRLDKDVDVIVVDSISVADGDYIDLGRPLGMGSVLPVIVKTIVFNY